MRYHCVYTEHQVGLNIFVYSSFRLLDRKWTINDYEPVTCYVTDIQLSRISCFYQPESVLLKTTAVLLVEKDS